MEQQNKGTKEQRNKGTKEQRNKETKSSYNWVRHNQVSWSSFLSMGGLGGEVWGTKQSVANNFSDERIKI